MREYLLVIAKWFTYHPPNGDQVERYREIRTQGQVFAICLEEAVPDCPERKIAMQRIREAVMWADAGIKCNEKE